MSMDTLIEKIVSVKNPTVMGLDPKLEYIPEFIVKKHMNGATDLFEAAASCLFNFNKELIDAVCDIVPAIKPQSAYYEMYGWQGVKALNDTIAYAHQKGMYVIVDGKRNDIGTTMEAYAAAYLGKTDICGQLLDAFGADALTVNGYLGTDGIAPLLQVCEKYDRGIFVLAKTSNPSSGELQDKKINSRIPVYELMGEMCEQWGAASIGKYGYSAVGAVVGATYPEQLKTLREKMPHTMFLVPGYGAQGGGAADVAHAFDRHGLGAIINSSRGIICAYQKEKCHEEDFAGAARREAIRMREDITQHIGNFVL